MQYTSNNPKDTKKIAADFAKVLKSKKSAVILFNAPMGAGKTTFISETVKHFSAKASSPTFTIINRYAPNLYHIDLYRIKNLNELYNTDFFDIIEGRNYVFIEWAEKLGESLAALKVNIITVKIEIKEGTGRVFDITY